jgi:hypothetical protein
MAHTNQTPNYGLSEFLGTDKPAWLVDYNGDMEKIDLGLKAAKDVADAAKAEADQGALDIASVTVTANSAEAKATEALSNTADAYDATSTYAINDYVLYNGILYRCITTISVPEAFNGDHWTRTTLETMIENVDSKVNSIVINPDGTNEYTDLLNATTFTVAETGFYRFGLVGAGTGGSLVTILQGGSTLYSFSAPEGKNQVGLVYLKANITYNIVHTGTDSSIRLYNI